MPAELGLVVEHTQTEWCGAIVRIAGGFVELADWRNRIRTFPLTDGYLIDGKRVALVPAAAQRASGTPDTPRTSSGARARTASGSFAVAEQRARVALPSRILVEGRHDAELVEKVWGADLRVEGVVVEYLAGIDHLETALESYAPNRERRIGVLVDHLVPGSKESRIAQRVHAGPHGAHVLVVGHPFVDVWQAIKPERIGLPAWPNIPRDVEWKQGICAALGWPHATQTDIANAWQQLLGKVRTFRDLESSLLGSVEQLIDFVTEPLPSRPH